ncbi:hypothetical protein E3P99_04036 [Wallemia hederae]|uniref:Uncharacterized protein n=1 Tax=Wallemia hederae TaxID=1540922 RepID=A0A4T0FB70_9BASI|nr:hypothetical protein E3P99_04036 [Wallemia hederae]
MTSLINANAILIGFALLSAADARNCYYVGIRYHCTGLSRGARIGIGVAVAVAVLLLIGVISLLFYCRRRRSLKSQGQAYEQQMYAPYQQTYPMPQTPYNQDQPTQGGYGYNPPPGPPPGMQDYQQPPAYPPPTHKEV